VFVDHWWGSYQKMWYRWKCQVLTIPYFNFIAPV